MQLIIEPCVLSMSREFQAIGYASYALRSRHLVLRLPLCPSRFRTEASTLPRQDPTEVGIGGAPPWRCFIEIAIMQFICRLPSTAGSSFGDLRIPSRPRASCSGSSELPWGEAKWSAQSLGLGKPGPPGSLCRLSKAHVLLESFGLLGC